MEAITQHVDKKECFSQLKRQLRTVGTRHIIGKGNGATDITEAIAGRPPLERVPHGTFMIWPNAKGEDVLWMKQDNEGDGIVPFGRIEDLRRAKSFHDKLIASMSYDGIRELADVVITAKTPDDLLKGIEGEERIAKKYSGA